MGKVLQGIIGKSTVESKKKGGRTEGNKDEEEKISREEMDMAIKNLKNEKSAGEDNWK